MPNLTARLWLTLLVMLPIFSTTALAGDDGVPQPATEWSLRGFGTFGMTRSTSGQAGFVRDLSQPKGVAHQWSGHTDSNIGLQANWRTSPSLEFVGQLVSRYRYDATYRPEATLAFVGWNPDPNLTIRAGRVGADFLMHADSRLIGYSYLTARPSVDFFGPLFFSRLDGIDASLSVPDGESVWRGKVQVGRISEKAPYSGGVWDTSGSSLGGFLLDHQRGPWRLRGSIASLRYSKNHDFGGFADLLRQTGAAYGFPSAIAAADAISAKNTRSYFYSLGALYDEGPVTVQALFCHMHHQTGLLQNSNAGYVLAGYRIGHVTPFVGVSRVNSSYKHNVTGLPAGGAFDLLNSNYDALMMASAMNQNTWTLGARWDFRKDMALKFQWDAVRGTPESRFLFTHPSTKWRGRTDVLSVNLDFVF